MTRTTKTTPPRDLVSLQDAAKYARVSPRTVRRWIASGALTAFRAGPKLIRVDRTELDAMMKPVPTAAGQ